MALTRLDNKVFPFAIGQVCVFKDYFMGTYFVDAIRQAHIDCFLRYNDTIYPTHEADEQQKAQFIANGKGFAIGRIKGFV